MGKRSPIENLPRASEGHRHAAPLERPTDGIPFDCRSQYRVIGSNGKLTGYYAEHI